MWSGGETMRYYIADLHFYHDALNEYMDKRGFASVEEMNEHIIAKWNAKVRKNDEVIILGDVSMGNPEQTTELLKRLKGKLFLIEGNHDDRYLTKDFDTSMFGWIKPYAELSDNRRKVVLCHYPIMFYNGQYRQFEDGTPKAYMLYGHVHDTMDQKLMERFINETRNTTITRPDGTTFNIQCNMINCFCMYSDYTPLTLDEWIELDKQRKNNVE